MATARNEFKLIGPDWERYNRSAVTLSCRLSPEISAVNMEIRWFKETDCVCVYKNREVTEGRGYRGRVSLFTQELERGNVSLQLRDYRGSDDGYYLCQVTDGDRTEEITKMQKKFMDKASWIYWSMALCSGGERENNLTLLFFPHPPLDKDFWDHQSDREWTEDERKKMEESVLLTEHSTDEIKEKFRNEWRDSGLSTNQEKKQYGGKTSNIGWRIV
ncbi:hypothetical protein KOW79_021767 [Hemibagrus wyckioides]|uniref:Ig-like domain-containing protein n=1 Tax=Hemibagrus wyckioides TaxID=337641 RepID=A0A9D3SD63_9TELE|nr:hypothetical protein KOW79_021767 [Hemibagrus wyckioides]